MMKQKEINHPKASVSLMKSFLIVWYFYDGIQYVFEEKYEKSSVLHAYAPCVSGSSRQSTMLYSLLGNNYINILYMLSSSCIK
jgi:hypothetical protein